MTDPFTDRTQIVPAGGVSASEPAQGSGEDAAAAKAAAQEAASNAAALANAPTIPDVIIEAKIGQGGMGVVYRGRQPYLDRLVAIKVLPTQMSQDNPKFVERFQREAKLLAGLHHPNIVICHQAGQTQTGACYLVMEFIDGLNLRQWIEKHGAISQADALDILHSLAEALKYAHENGIIHRDVKPENVLLLRKPDKPGAPPSAPTDFNFMAKLVDLGLARPNTKDRDDTGMQLTAAGTVMGTPATMAPEQFNDPDSVDHRADIYGLGCILYHCVVGEPAFPESELMKIVQRKARGDVPAPRQRRQDVRIEMDTLCRELLAADRNRRPEYDALLKRCEALLKSGNFPRRTTGVHAPVGRSSGGVNVGGPNVTPMGAATMVTPAGGGAYGAPHAGPGSGAGLAPRRPTGGTSVVGGNMGARPHPLEKPRSRDPLLWLAIGIGAFAVIALLMVLLFWGALKNLANGNAPQPSTQQKP